MDAHRWILCSTLLVTLALCAACVADDVVYVDEQGNELAVDESGKPILPGQAPSMEMPPAPPAELVEMPPPAPVEPAPRAVVAVPADTSRPNTQPAPDPSWNLPPARKTGPAGLPSVPSWTQPAPKPAKKVNSSANLDRPPAG